VAWLPLTIALSAAEAALASGVSFGALAQIGQTIATLLGGLARIQQAQAESERQRQLRIAARDK